MYCHYQLPNQSCRFFKKTSKVIDLNSGVFFLGSINESYLIEFLAKEPEKQPYLNVLRDNKYNGQKMCMLSEDSVM